MFSTEVKAGLLAPPARGDDPRHHRRERGAMGMSIATADAPADTGRFHPAPGVIVDRRGRPPRRARARTSPASSPCPAAPRATTRTTPRRRPRSGSSTACATRSPATTPRSTPTAPSPCSAAGSSCINTAGEKVYPEEVEEVLKAQPAVEDALVFGVADERFGQRVAAVLSHAPGPTTTGRRDPRRRPRAARRLQAPPSGRRRRRGAPHPGRQARLPDRPRHVRGRAAFPED